MSFTTIDWQKYRRRSDEIVAQLSSSALDNIQRAALQRELSHLTVILDRYEDIRELENLRTDLEEQKRATDDASLIELFDDELKKISDVHDKHVVALEGILFPPDERDNLSAFLEIRAGAGGQEASLFVGDLARMYMMYAQRKNWQASVVSESPTDVGGYREIVLCIRGKGVFGHLKFEAGVHRVQRVPKTETAGRIHTSTVTVAVFPELKEADTVEINPADLRIDVYRAGGAGGQHVNKTDSAVRITHIPTGLVVACQEDRSQHKNKATAMKILGARLQNLQREKQEAEVSQQRRDQIGGGTRAEKVRTYNFPQNRVTDHQVDVTLSKLNMVMDGDLEDIVVPLREHERLERRKSEAIS